MEQALRHVLSEQETLLQRPDCDQLCCILSSLNRLAIDTSDVLIGSLNSIRSTKNLTRAARDIERAVDDISEVLWTHLRVSVSSVYERIEDSLERKPGKPGFISDTRAHYHNLRVRLLEQTLGARSLVLNSDLGDEHERIWQQFFERHLGPSFKILRGGHIYGYEGNRSSAQIDLIVVPAEAQIFIPGDSEGGKTAGHQ